MGAPRRRHQILTTDSSLRRRVVPLVLLALALLAVAPAAYAAWWVEVVVRRDDIRVAVERSGQAEVEHRIEMRIAGGPLYEYEVVGVDPDADVLPDAYAVPKAAASKSSLENAVPVTVTLKKDADAEPTLALELNGKEGLSRGIWIVQLRYRTDLAARGLIRRNGVFTQVDWLGPRWMDGLDANRATFAIPTASTPPRANDAPADPLDQAEIPATFLSSLNRTGPTDELELLRPYAPRGERVPWSMLVDRRALGVALQDDAVANGDASPTSALAQRRDAPVVVLGEARPLVLLGAALGVFLLVGGLTIAKFLGFSRLARTRHATSRPMVPMPTALRGPLAGATFVGGIACQLLLVDSTWGSALVLIAAALMTHRSPTWNKPQLRPPGNWLVVAPHEVFGPPAPEPLRWLDASAWLGRLTLFIALAGMAGSTWYAAQTSSTYAVVIGLDSVALLALWLTGRMDELPPEPIVGAGRVLEPIFKRLQKSLRDIATVTPRIRVPHGSADPDELRLAIRPKRPRPGLAGIEVGVLSQPGTGGVIHAAEVLVRAHRESHADRLLDNLQGNATVVRGRSPGERVLAFTPRQLGSRTAAALTAAIAVRCSLAAAAEEAGKTERANDPTADASKAETDDRSRAKRRAPIRRTTGHTPPPSKSDAA